MSGETIGKVICQARLDKGMNLEELAAAVKCSYNTLRQWETDRAQPIRIFRERLEQILGVKLPEKDTGASPG